MIISCEKCNKKFELEDNLIPESGRFLQCGSCSHKWHYMPDKIIKLDQEIGQINENILTEDKIKIICVLNILWEKCLKLEFLKIRVVKYLS